jgi:hypothetical protein
MRRPATLALLAASALLALAGCSSPCRELSEKLCDCLKPVEREECQRTAANEERRLEPTAEDEMVCEEKLETCTCEALETDEGKRACGLAR